MKSALLLASVSLLMGCEHQSQFPMSGTYTGTLLSSGASARSEIVAATLTSDTNTEEESVTISAPVSGKMELTLQKSADHSLKLQLSGAFAVSTELIADNRASSENLCFQSNSGRQISLCMSSDLLTLDLLSSTGEPIMNLVLNRQTAAPVPLESPRAYTLDQAMQRTFAMEFNTRIEFQRVIEAKKSSVQAYLNLFPHVSANSVLSSASSTAVLNMLTSIGDLAPFALPSRWLQAKEASDLARAEADSLVVMRADAGLQTEALSYAGDRDTQIAALYDATLSQLDSIIKQIKSGEASGHYPAGSSDLLSSVRMNIESDAAELDLAREEQRTYFAQALGFVNPDAITAISVPSPLVPIDNATDLSASPYQQLVLDRSYELRQMTSLIQAARTAKKAILFNWMDPQGDTTAGLGPELGAAIEVGKAKVTELMTTHDQMQSLLLQKLAVTIDEYNDSMEDHERAGRKLGINTTLLNRELQALNAGGPVNFLNLTTAIPAELDAQADQKNTEAEYRISGSKLNRLLFQAYYEHVSSSP